MNKEIETAIDKGQGVTIALIIAVTAITCVSLNIYFSPFHSCLRGEGEGEEILCAQVVFGSDL